MDIYLPDDESYLYSVSDVCIWQIERFIIHHGY